MKDGEVRRQLIALRRIVRPPQALDPREIALGDLRGDDQRARRGSDLHLASELDNPVGRKLEELHRAFGIA
jgi:hypothetical protein